MAGDWMDPNDSSKPSQEPGDNLPPVAIPDHDLLRCIGKGSYGKVWLARNRMGVFRAVKVVYRDSFNDARPFEREWSGIRRFEPVSRSHQGFMDVLHVGIEPERGYFYYVMELGDDETSGQDIEPARYKPKTLAGEISRRSLSAQECLQLGLALTEALFALHEHGLVHRDVKPSNIIFFDGVPKLADIGLVAEAREAPSYVGTEGFIPPEGPGTPQADIYSLGKVLYEASTGKDRHEFRDLPTLLGASPDSEKFLELNEVILRACQPKIADRYRTTWDMHADLLVIANERSVKRLRSLERRLTRLKRIVGIAAAAIVAAGVVAYQVETSLSRARLEHARKVDANVINGWQSMASGNSLGALPYFATAAWLDQSSRSARDQQLRFGSVRSQSPKLAGIWFLHSEIKCGTFSPDSKSALFVHYETNVGGASLVDLRDTSKAPTMLGPPWLQNVAFSADGRLAVLVDASKTAWVYPTDTWKSPYQIVCPCYISGARFSPDGTLLAIVCNDGYVRIWDLRTTTFAFQLPHPREVRFAGFSHNGRLIVTCCMDGSTRLWDVASRNCIHILPGRKKFRTHDVWANHAAFSPDDSELVVASTDNEARVWNVTSGQKRPPDMPHLGIVSSAEYSPDGRFIVTGSYDGNVRLWRSDTLQPAESSPLIPHNDPVIDACFSPDGRRILTTCNDGTIRLWDLAGEAATPYATCSAISDDGRTCATVTNRTIQILDCATAQPACPAIHVDSLPLPLALSSNGRFLIGVFPAVGSSNCVLRAWNTTTSQPLMPDLSVPGPILGAVVNNTGASVLTYGGTNVQIWRLATQSAVSLPLQHDPPVTNAFASPDGAKFGTLSGDKVYLWSAADGQPAFAPLLHDRPVTHAEFSPDSSRLVSCCADPSLDAFYAQVWDAKTGRPVGPRLMHGDGVLWAAFAPGGKRVVTGGEDFMAMVWNCPDGTEIGLPMRHSDQVKSVAFSPDGRWVITACANNTVQIWDAETGQPLTSPLPQTNAVPKAKFLAGASGFFSGNRTNGTLWKLTLDDRPATDLIQLGELLTGGGISQLGGPPTVQKESLQVLWDRLRAKYPSDFEVSPEAIDAWYNLQVKSSRDEEQWFAEAFNLRQLLALHPGDPNLIKQLAIANQRLAAATSASVSNAPADAAAGTASPHP
jgi:WD40 repeat protein